MTTKMSRATVIPSDTHGCVTAGMSTRRDRAAPDGPGPTVALDPTFEAEAAVPVTAASPPDSGIASAATRRARPASASDLHPSRFRRVLVDDDILWMLDPGRRVTIVQVAGVRCERPG